MSFTCVLRLLIIRITSFSTSLNTFLLKFDEGDSFVQCLIVPMPSCRLPSLQSGDLLIWRRNELVMGIPLCLPFPPLLQATLSDRV